MPSVPNVIQDLKRYGPDVLASHPVTLPESQDYCRQLATTHYENFTVVSWLLPRHLRQHFFNVYAYCRWADDLADEAADGQQSLELLKWWETLLDKCFQKEAVHPVFVALQETITEFSIPVEPFRELLIAFRQDQIKTRYQTFEELLAYCRNSANPVGRLILYLGRCYRAETVALSDSICTGLQLANFCQDVARDAARGRIYLPRESWGKFHCDEALLQRGEVSNPLRQLLASEVMRAAQFLLDGWPLVDNVPKELQFDVALFAHGGLAILESIARRRFDVWTARPTLSKLEKIQLMAKAWMRRRPSFPHSPPLSTDA